jgi:signal transduction histidine kinase
VTVAVPEFAPTTALIVVLPMVLGLPYLTSRHLDVVGAVATVMVTAVALLGLMESGVVDGGALPTWVPLLLLAPTSLSVALLAVVALADVRSTVNATNDRLQATLIELTDAFDSTRRQVERDLHDGAQQHLAALAIQLGVVRRLTATPDRAARILEALACQVEEARNELQRLVDGSFGDVLRSLGVGRALERASGNSTTVVTNDVESLPTHVALATYFVCHEAMQNATKHAGAAATIEVDIRVVDDPVGTRVEFSVADDGVGCDPARLMSGHGVSALRSRLEEVGGTLVATSEPGRGTTVSGVIPIGTEGGGEPGHGRTYPIP